MKYLLLLSIVLTGCQTVVVEPTPGHTQLAVMPEPSPSPTPDPYTGYIPPGACTWKCPASLFANFEESSCNVFVAAWTTTPQCLCTKAIYKGGPTEPQPMGNSVDAVCE